MLFRGNEFTSPAGFTFAVVLAAPSATLPLHVSRKLSGASYRSGGAARITEGLAQAKLTPVQAPLALGWSSGYLIALAVLE